MSDGTLAAEIQELSKLAIDQSTPVSSLVRRAALLAGRVPYREYEMLFGLHRDGISSERDPSSLVEKWAEPRPPRWDIPKAFFADRSFDKNTVQGHSLAEMETLLRESVKLRTEGTEQISARDYQKGSRNEQSIRGILERVRSRVLKFIAEVQSNSVRPAAILANEQKVVQSGSQDREMMQLAIDNARRCRPEDERSHPYVGVVVVSANGVLLDSAFRGEIEAGDHAEFTVLEKKLAEQSIVGATVYATLEPCTSRNDPKIPCADRLIERKVKRVVIGMLDPNPAITGRGLRRLRDANIEIDLFPTTLMAQLEELNRHFIRRWELDPSLESRAVAAEPNTRNPRVMLVIVTVLLACALAFWAGQALSPK